VYMALSNSSPWLRLAESRKFKIQVTEVRRIAMPGAAIWCIF
jgi:hypothetical protein